MLGLGHIGRDVREVAQLYGALHHRQAHVDNLLGRRAVVPRPHIALERALQQVTAMSAHVSKSTQNVLNCGNLTSAGHNRPPKTGQGSVK